MNYEPSFRADTETDLQRAVREHDKDMARLDRNTLPADALERCGYCNKQIVQAACGSGYVHVETGLTACIVAHPSDPLSPKATRLSQDVRRCSAQACCRIEGHEGNHWCSVCNVRDLAGVEYFEHECYPTEV